MHCSHTPTTAADLIHKRRFPAEVQSAIEDFRREFGDVLGEITDDMADRIASAGPTNVQSVVDVVISSHEDEIVAALKEGGAEGVDAGRRMASRRFGLEIDLDQRPESAINAIEDTVDNFADDSLAEMAERFESDLEGWFDEGLDVDDIAGRMRSADYADQLDARHAETHARTLVQSASEKGNHEAMREAPGVIGERWNVTTDGRERDTHAEAAGQIVPVDSTFIVGGDRLEHPGDPAASVKEIANCRCYATPVFEDDLTDDEVAQLRAGQRLNI